MSLHVVATGPLTTVQDLGRPGLAHLGVGRSGAADRPAHRLANRLVGNPESAASLETTLAGLTLVTDSPAWVVLTGAPATLLTRAGTIAPGTPAFLPAGSRVEVGMPPTGLRSYLAVRGGIAVEPVLGSRSTDVLAHLGPPALAPGTVVAVGEAPPTWPAPVDHASLPALDPEPTLDLLLGPREDWFDREALAVLERAPWEVTAESNRVGVRLAGPPLARAVHEELPSEGMVAGAVQVPPGGRPILVLADHPVTGGYPVIGVLTAAGLARAAQLRPGTRCRLRVLGAAGGRSGTGARRTLDAPRGGPAGPGILGR